MAIIAFNMTIISFKGAIRDFYNLLTAQRTVSNTHAQVTEAKSCANHVQYIERLSRATCRVTCHAERRDSSAIKFDRVYIAFCFSFILLTEPLTDGGGRWREKRSTVVRQVGPNPHNTIGGRL